MKRWTLILLIGCTVLGGFAGYLLAGGRAKHPSLQTEDVFSLTPHMAAPEDFALFPCTPISEFEDPYAPCVLVIAGGKRLVFGAPIYQNWRGIGEIDAAFLMYGHPMSSGGLAGLRLETWRNGRNTRLLIIAGDLQAEAIQALDDLNAGADALIAIESRGKAGFLEAGLRVKPVPVSARGFKVFDTGDLTVLSYSTINDAGDQVIAYRLDYGATSAMLYPCGAEIDIGSVDYLILPTAEKAGLVARQREQAEQGQLADVQDLQRIGKSCPGVLDAGDLGQAANARGIVLLRAARDLDTPLPETESWLAVLGPEGIILSEDQTRR